MIGRPSIGLLLASAGLSWAGPAIAAASPPPMLPYALVGLAEEDAPSWPRARAAAADDGELTCLATAIYYEARSEAEDGQRAVAQVVLNRVNRPSFARSVCGVVHQRGSTGCQFKFICDGAQRAPRENRAWTTAMRIARSALSGEVFQRIGAATFYHTVAVSPGWSQRLTRVAVIGQHIFYRGRIG